MIVKNEEEQLPRCLDSIKDFCDEIIVVDTGSEDDTIKIAKSFGAKVYRHPWENNFSLHRNQAFDYANGEWLLVIDADEEMKFKDISPEEFRSRLDMIPYLITSLIVTVNEFHAETYTSWQSARFFRANVNPRYEGTVHNKIKCDGQAAGTDLELIHYGYHLSPEKMKKKRDRTRKLLEERIEKDPHDHLAHYYLCQMAQGDGNWAASIDHGLQCIEALPFEHGDEMQFFAVLYFWMANAYMKLEDAGNCLAWLEKGLEFFPNDIDLNYLMVLFNYRIENRGSMIEHAKRYFSSVRKVRNRNSKKSTEFVNILDKEDFLPRTMYCIGDRHKDHVKKWLQKSKEFANV